MHLSPGMMVSANVRLTQPLGEGAMGCVWIADHLTLKTEVAVKFIATSLALEDPEILERFAREASLAAQIKSPHVVQTFDQGVMADGTPYIVMELLEGESLQELIEREGKLGLSLTAQIIVQVARALARAHDLGIVHRDIKPDNIFITHSPDGIFAKILDFGIAKQTKLPKMGGLTNPGVMVGTPEYMSPEQVLSAKDVDYRADMWALAVTAYHCLTGDLPFTAEALGTLCVKLLDGKFEPASSINPTLHAGFDAFFSKALATSPDNRHSHVRELANELVENVRQSGATDVDGLSYGGLPPAHVLATTPLPQGVHTAPLPSLSAPTAPLPVQAASMHGAAPASTGTFSGSSSNRRQVPMRGMRPATLIASVFAVLAVVALVAVVSTRDSGEPATQDEARTNTQAPTASAPAAATEPTVSAAPATPSASASSTAAPSAEPSAEPSAKTKSTPRAPAPPPIYPQPLPKPGIPAFPGL